MVEQGRSRGRDTTWRPWPGAGDRPMPAWPDVAGLARPLGERLRAWALADVGPGRLVPWLAIAFGFGIILYFTADREPQLWAASLLLRRGRCGRMRCAATGPWRSRSCWPSPRRRRVSSPRPQSAPWSLIRCCRRPPGTSRSQALSRCARSASAPTASSCAFTALPARGLSEPPDRVRVSVRKGTAPPVASFRGVQGAAIAAARAVAAGRL